MITLVIASLATNRGRLKDVSGDKSATIDGCQLTAFSKVFIGNHILNSDRLPIGAIE
mgnify:CR=1 FL=1